MNFGLFKYRVENFNPDNLYKEDKKEGSIYKIKEANEIIEMAYIDSRGLHEEEKEAYLKAIYEKYYNSLESD